MSEENVNPSDQVATEESATPEDFSLFDVLEGVSFPESEITVALNEKAAFDLRRAIHEGEAMQDPDASPTEDEIADLRKRMADLHAQVEKSKLTFYLRGVSGELVSSAKDIVDGMFEDKQKSSISATGQPIKYIPQSEHQAYARMLNAVVMSMYVTQVKDHGKNRIKTGMNADEMAAFYDKAPAAAKSLLSGAITELQVEAAEYEATLDEGFFPKS